MYQTMDLKRTLGKELTGIRLNDLEMTQKELAEELGISVVYISYLEMGKKIPSLELLEKLYKLAGLNDVPQKTKDMLTEIKVQAKKELTDSKIRKILEENNAPDDTSKIYETLETLIEQDKIKEAKNYILKSLMNIEKVQEKKLLEALYYELEGNFIIAIKLMKEAMELSND